MTIMSELTWVYRSCLMSIVIVSSIDEGRIEQLTHGWVIRTFFINVLIIRELVSLRSISSLEFGESSQQRTDAFPVRESRPLGRPFPRHVAVRNLPEAYLQRFRAGQSAKPSMKVHRFPNLHMALCTSVRYMRLPIVWRRAVP